MRTYAESPKARRQTEPAGPTKSGRAPSEQSSDLHPLLHLQSLIGNQAVQRRLARKKPTRVDGNTAQRSSSGTVDEKTANEIRSLKGTGQPLSKSSRAFFEPRFGSNLSRVRIHADSQSARLARAMQARAFTLGNDIGFNAGQYAPESFEGRRLLAHELVHTLQQAGRDLVIQRDCAADPGFTRMHTYWAWIDGKILDWQQIALNKIRFWLNEVLIANTRTRTAQLSTRLTRTERTVARADANAANVGLAFAGNMLWVLAGLGPQRPLTQALQVGGALIASLSSMSFDTSHPVNTPQFLDAIGGLGNLVSTIQSGTPFTLTTIVADKRQHASDTLCRAARAATLPPDAIYLHLFRDTFPELPESVAAAQGPASAAALTTPQEGTATSTTTGTTPNLAPPTSVDTDFLGAVEADIMQKMNDYMRQMAGEARAKLRESESEEVTEQIASGHQVAERDMRQVMEHIGISETAEALAVTTTDTSADIEPSQRFNQLQAFLDNDSFRVRLQAIMSMARLARTGDSPRELVIPELIRKLSDEEEIVQVAAADALAQLNAVLAIPAIYRALGLLEDEAHRSMVQSVLSRLLGHAARP